MNKQPEALRLADELDVGDFDVLTNYEAADELRRLHNEVSDLKQSLDIADAVFKEREACAKEAELWGCNLVALSIRARNPK